MHQIFLIVTTASCGPLLNLKYCLDEVRLQKVKRIESGGEGLSTMFSAENEINSK
jgi:hypothetical protein